MMTKMMLFAALAAATATGANAQALQPTPQAVQAAPQAVVTNQPVAQIQQTTDNVLRAGARVSVRLLEELTTKEKQARVGQRFRMEIAESVMHNGIVVLPVGSPVTGEIVSVRNKGMWGKSGHISARVLYATVQGRQVRLTGTFDDKGVTGTAGVVGAIAVAPVIGFFVTGTSAQIPAGTTLPAFLDEDLTISM